MDKYINPLHSALKSDDPGAFYKFWDSTSTGDFRRQIEELIADNRNDLKAFTMAAMQGLCANPNIVDADKNGIYNKEGLGEAAFFIARATLAELSKQQ